MKYTILKTQYSEKPYFCVTATGLRILNLILALECYALCECIDEDYDMPYQDFLKTERWQNFFAGFDFEETWGYMYEKFVETSEEPVEAWYGDDDLIDFYASGKLELSDLILLEYFDFEGLDEIKEIPPIAVVQDSTFKYNVYIVLVLILLVVSVTW